MRAAFVHRHRLHTLAGLACVLQATQSWAQAAAAPAASPAAVGSGGGLLQMTLGLAIVLAVIFVAAWLLRRIGMPHAGNHHLLKPVGSLALGTRERIMVVEIQDQWLVLGVTASQITPLLTLNKSSLTADKAQSTPSSGLDSLFGQKLKELLRRSEK